MEKMKKNYYYLGTGLYLLVAALCFFVLKDNIDKIVAKDSMWNTLVSPFRFETKDQLILCSIPFVVVSLFLEKNYGSINYLLLILLGIPIVSLVNLSVIQAGLYTGMNLLNYYLIGVFLVNILFNLKKYKNNAKEAVLPIIVLILLFVLCSWNVTQVLGVKEIKDLLEFEFLCKAKEYVNRTAIFIGAVIALISKVLKNENGDSYGW